MVSPPDELSPQDTAGGRNLLLVLDSNAHKSNDVDEVGNFMDGDDVEILSYKK